jgi:hypothetical protein
MSIGVDREWAERMLTFAKCSFCEWNLGPRVYAYPLHGVDWARILVDPPPTYPNEAGGGAPAQAL